MNRATARPIVVALCLASCAFPSGLGHVGGSGGGAVFDGSRFTKGLRIRPVHLRFASEGTNLPPRAVTAREEAFTDAASAWTKGCMPDGPFELMQATNLPAFPASNAPVVVFICSTTLVSISAVETNALQRYLRSGGTLVVVADPWQPALTERLVGERLLAVADDDPVFHEPFEFVDGLCTCHSPLGCKCDRLLAARARERGRWGLFFLPPGYSSRWIGNVQDRATIARDSQFLLNILYYCIARRQETVHREPVPVRPAAKTPADDAPEVVSEIPAVTNPPPRETSDLMNQGADSFRRTLNRKDDRFR